jgi:hypothetical protein
MVYILFSLPLSLFRVYAFVRLSIGQTVILGVKEENRREYRSHFIYPCFYLQMLVIICVHRRSYILSFRSKVVVVVVVVMPFFLVYVLFLLFLYRPFDRCG